MYWYPASTCWVGTHFWVVRRCGIRGHCEICRCSRQKRHTSDHDSRSSVQFTHCKRYPTPIHHSQSQHLIADPKRYSQRRMNNTLMQVNLDTPRYKRSSRELRPFLRVVSVVMADDDSPRRRVGNIVENICAKALDADG
jgi:hypothetical protein